MIDGEKITTKMPKMLYGTAWKAKRTSELVIAALRCGFRGIDTACQPKHYNEKGVGEGVKYVLQNDGIRREDLFIQTKFTSIDGQDPHTIPYDTNSSLEKQVEQSLNVSLKNLDVSYLDSLVLHGSLRTHNENMTVWKQFEKFVEQGKVSQLGVSNFYNIAALRNLYNQAKIKPKVVQNRFYRDTLYDKSIREFCSDHNIKYQSFWTLSANPHILNDPAVLSMAEARSKTPAQLFFAYLMQLGIVPLTGTTSLIHMNQDVEAMNLVLSSDEMATFEPFIN